MRPTTRTLPILAAVALLCGTVPTLAQEPGEAGERRGNQEFIGVDLDNGGVYYNGRNSGRYCLYQTVEVFNRANRAAPLAEILAGWASAARALIADARA